MIHDETPHAPAAWGKQTSTAGCLLMFNIAHDNERYGDMVTYLLKGPVPLSSSPEWFARARIVR